MPRFVNCVKSCCYFGFLAGLITAICTLFVWQAEVYQTTIDDQIRSMKLELSAMKKENHLMEIKLNEQLGKHDDLKDEFRYLIKQAKWPAELKLNDNEEKNVRSIDENDNNNVDKRNEDAINQALKNAIDNMEVEAENEIDLSKRAHIVVVAEAGGGGDVLAEFLDNDSSIFLLPDVSGIISTPQEFDKLAHCTFTDKVVSYYQNHSYISMKSKSLKKFCQNGSCVSLTKNQMEKECISRYVGVFQGLAEDWPLALLEKLSMDKVYLSRDPRSIVAEMLTTEKLTEESVQAFSNELCVRVESFNDHQTTSHHTYQVIKYETLAKSPLTSLSTLYHSILDTTSVPNLTLTRDYKNKLYLSVSTWKTQLAEIILDAVKEECGSVIKS